MATILVIDDEEFVLDALRMTLESGGHDVFEASDGEEGVSEFELMVKRSNAPDIVIVDILMPKKDGYQTIVEIKEIVPDVHIIAISGGGDIDPKLILGISSMIGADRILSKPFMPDDLRSAVGLCLQ